MGNNIINFKQFWIKFNTKTHSFTNRRLLVGHSTNLWTLLCSPSTMNARRTNHWRARGAMISKRVGCVKQVNGRHCLHPLQRNSKCLPVHIDNAFSLGIHVFEMMLATCSSSLRKKGSVIQNTRILCSKSCCSPRFELFIRQPYLDLLIRHHLFSTEIQGMACFNKRKLLGINWHLDTTLGETAFDVKRHLTIWCQRTLDSQKMFSKPFNCD